MLRFRMLFVELSKSIVSQQGSHAFFGAYGFGCTHFFDFERRSKMTFVIIAGVLTVAMLIWIVVGARLSVRYEKKRESK